MVRIGARRLNKRDNNRSGEVVEFWVYFQCRGTNRMGRKQVFINVSMGLCLRN